MTAVRAVARAFERGIGPLRLAEAWDNVGLLLESPVSHPKRKKILLTIDLTTAVAEEALSNSASVIVSYHPPIFSGLKSLTLGNPLQRSLLRCAAEGISVFSPHTALDSVRGGVNDTLAASLGELSSNNILGELKEGDAGAGRIVTLSEPVPLERIFARVKSYCGLSHIQAGIPPRFKSTNNAPGDLIHTVALCAGSGGSVLKGAKADVYLTGEMSHHEILAAVAQGTGVILCGHSNTERPYLSTLQKKLQDALNEDPELQNDVYEVVVSEADADPLVIV